MTDTEKAEHALRCAVLEASIKAGIHAYEAFVLANTLSGILRRYDAAVVPIYEQPLPPRKKPPSRPVLRVVGGRHHEEPGP